MTERKGQRAWLQRFIPNWLAPGESRKMYAAEMFHEYDLHADEVGESPDYLNDIYRRELDEDILLELKHDHDSQDFHELDPKPDESISQVFE